MDYPPPPGKPTFMAHCSNCGGEHPHYRTEDDLSDEFRGDTEPILLRFNWCTNCDYQTGVTPRRAA
jgi:hypothetical protein